MKVLPANSHNAGAGLLPGLWLLLAGLVGAPSLQAQDPDMDPAARLAGILAQTDSLSAEVEQLVLDQDGREVQEARALLQMRKPASFRWEVSEPWEELTVTDGERIWRYEPDLEQVTIRRFDEALDRTPVMLLNADAATIAEAFDVEAVDVDTGGITRFVLHPRQPDSLFERLSLGFKGVELLEMHWEDSLGQQSSLAFRSLQRNVALPDARFRFAVPPGIDVIDTVSNTEGE